MANRQCSRFDERPGRVRVSPSLTAVFCEALMAEFTQALEAVVDVLHFLLQVRVLLVQLFLFGVPLQWGDQILVYFC